MINNELLTFIKERLAQGSSKDQITDMLVTHGGWDNKDVEEAYDTLDIAGSSMKSVMDTAQKMTGAVNIQSTISPVENKPLSGAVPHGITPTENTVRPISVQPKVSVSPSPVTESPGFSAMAKMYDPVTPPSLGGSATPVLSTPIGFGSGQATKTTEPVDVSKLSGAIVSEDPHTAHKEEKQDIVPPTHETSPFTKLSELSQIKQPDSPPKVSGLSAALRRAFSSSSKQDGISSPEPIKSQEVASKAPGTGTMAAGNVLTGINFGSSVSPKVMTPSSSLPTSSSVPQPESRFQQPAKSLTPTVTPGFASARMNTYTPPNAGGTHTPVGMGTMSPAEGVGMKTQETLSLGDIKSRFSSGATVGSSEKYSPSVSGLKPATPGSGMNPSLGIGSNEASPLSKFTPPETKPGLSPHLQSGMVPTQGAVASSALSASTARTPEPSRGAAAFGGGQKLPGVVPPLVQHTHVTRNEPPKGRKLLATIMFLMGLVIGATGMHAYLNEYFDPLINWAEENIPGLTQNGS